MNTGRASQGPRGNVNAHPVSFGARPAGFCERESTRDTDAVIAKLSPRLRIQELEHERDRLRLLLDRAALRVAVLELAFDVNE